VCHVKYHGALQGRRACSMIASSFFHRLSARATLCHAKASLTFAYLLLSALCVQPTQEDEELLAQSNFWERIELPRVKVLLLSASTVSQMAHDNDFMQGHCHGALACQMRPLMSRQGKSGSPTAAGGCGAACIQEKEDSGAAKEGGVHQG